MAKDTTIKKKSKAKKYIWISLFFILSLSIAAGSFYYFGSYSAGDRAGVVIKISEKGYLFKTWEGEMNLNDQGNTIEKFEFSVDDDNTRVIEELKDAALTGERVRISYDEKYKAFPWRGDTKYFITNVVRQTDARRNQRGRVDTENNVTEQDEKPSEVKENNDSDEVSVDTTLREM